MVDHELLRAEGIMILRPNGSLGAADFEGLAQEIDPYIETNGKLNGLMLDADSFPGWKDFAALIAHLKFVRDHHRKIQKVAVVSDSGFLAVAPRFASHFVQADLRHFPQSQGGAALAWLRGEPTLSGATSAPATMCRSRVSEPIGPRNVVNQSVKLLRGRPAPACRKGGARSNTITSGA